MLSDPEKLESVQFYNKFAIGWKLSIRGQKLKNYNSGFDAILIKLSVMKGLSCRLQIDAFSRCCLFLLQHSTLVSKNDTLESKVVQN